MALVTYLIRAAVFVFGDKLAFPPLVRTALSFVPVTVLTAIIVPMTVSPHGNGAELTLAQFATGRGDRRDRRVRRDAPAVADDRRVARGVFLLATGRGGLNSRLSCARIPQVPGPRAVIRVEWLRPRGAADCTPAISTV